MPNFDSFERIFKSAVSGEISIQDGAKQIAGLGEINKVQVVKGKNPAQLEEFLARGSNALNSFFPAGVKFSSNDNNKDGKDLLEELSGTQIELKSGGAMTDANSGLTIVSWAVGDSDNQITRIMKKGLTDRRALAIKRSDQSEIDKSKSQTMDALAKLLDEKIKLGPAPDTLAHYFRCVAVGLTKSQEILDSYRSTSKVKTPLLLEAEWNSGLVLYEKAFLPDEVISVTSVERTKERVQLVAKGSKSGRIAKLYPNYKNSWKLADGSRVHASNWVETPCFHVWIDKA